MNQNQLKKCKQASMKPQDNVWMLRRVFFPGKNFSSNCRSGNEEYFTLLFFVFNELRSTFKACRLLFLFFHQSHAYSLIWASKKLFCQDSRFYLVPRVL